MKAAGIGERHSDHVDMTGIRTVEEFEAMQKESRRRLADRWDKSLASGQENSMRVMGDPRKPIIHKEVALGVYPGAVCNLPSVPYVDFNSSGPKFIYKHDDHTWKLDTP